MPNLTKKSKKPSRLSRLVAGMQTPKRRSSLVVETGFPTSLIDLIVKNRDRLKKKKETQMEISKPVLFKKERVIEIETLGQRNGEAIGGIKAVEILSKKDDKNNDDVVVVDDDNFVDSVFVQFLKMFVVVVLGLCTRRLVVGITLSAFLLVLFEFVGRGFKGLFRKDCRRKDCHVGVNESNGVGLRPREEEIRDDRDEIVEDRPSDCSSGELVEGGVIRELIEEDGAEVCKGRKKGKKFIKKIVKRLKSVKENKKKKKNKNEKKEVVDEVKGDEFLSSRYEFIADECDKGRQGQVNGEERFSVSSRDIPESEIINSGELCRADAELSMGEENAGNEKKTNSGYLLLVLVVLAGLFGGRIMALAITISWCMMLKFVCKLRGHVNEPLLRSSVFNSS